MKVIKAKTAGFCFGVKRAVDTVYKQVDTKCGQIYTYGPIIHNEEVIKDMRDKGVIVLRSEEDLDMISQGTVIIRSHGVEKRIYEKIEQKGLRIVDATCPFVKKIHNIVSEKSGEGFHIIIIGNPEHPEVVGIKGWAKDNVTVIQSAEDAECFTADRKEKICIVSQTTFNYNKFKDLVEILRKKRYDNSVLNMGDILNTICNATEERQKEAQNIAGEVDTMLVIGGRHSSNTQKLFEICKKECGNTYYIQTPVDLDSEMFQCSSYVGITAGASTPNKIIEEVQEHVRIKF